jgi:hypothetical protein
LARDLGRSGQNKSWETERERTKHSFLKILNSVYKYPSAEERKKFQDFSEVTNLTNYSF